MNFINKIRTVVPMEKRSKEVAFGISTLAMSLDNLSNSGGQVSITDIQEKFNVPSTQATWIISGYALTLGSFIMLSGKLTDIFGPHNVFLVGSGFMSLFALICAVIDKSIIILIIFRALQGMAGSTLLPSGMALCAGYFKDDPMKLKLATKFMIAAVTCSLGFGAVIGGAFNLASIGYKAFFYFVFGVAFISFFLLLLLIVPPEKKQNQKQLYLKDLNYGGVIVLVVGLLLLTLGLNEGGENWNSPKVYVTIPVGFAMVLSVFLFEALYIKSYRKKHSNNIPIESISELTEVIAERNEPGQPSLTGFESSKDWRLTMDYLFPTECLEVPNFLVFLFILIPFFMTFTVAMTALFQFHIDVDHDSIMMASLKVFPIGLGAAIGAICYRPGIVTKLGTRYYLMIITVLVLGTSIWFTRINFAAKKEYLKYEMFSLFFHTFFINGFFNVFMGSILVNTPTHLQGSIVGIFWTAGQVGIALGNAIFTCIVGDLHTVNSHDDKKETQKRIVDGMYLCVAASALAFVVSFFTKDTDSSRAKRKECLKAMKKKSDADLEMQKRRGTQ